MSSAGAAQRVRSARLRAAPQGRAGRLWRTSPAVRDRCRSGSRVPRMAEKRYFVPSYMGSKGVDRRGPACRDPTWGAPRIHGELLKLGFTLVQSTVSKYLPRHRKPPSQSWRTLLQNHLREAIAIDFAVVSTVTFGLLYVFVVLSLERRRLLHVHVTAHPTAVWTTQQMIEALPEETGVRYVIRDSDAMHGTEFQRRVAGMSLAEVAIAPRSPWQNCYAERFVGSLRRECLNHVIALNERQVYRIISSYARYYNRVRTHLALAKD